jgi:hypothetical protein
MITMFRIHQVYQVTSGAIGIVKLGQQGIGCIVALIGDSLFVRTLKLLLLQADYGIELRSCAIVVVQGNKALL